MTQVSAVLITLNEEPRLAAALESVRFCDEVLVLDAGSTDRTREIAAAAGARVETRPWDDFTSQRNHAAAIARHDWVLAVDADERVTPALRAEIDALRASGFAHAGYRIPRVAFYLGRWTGGLVHESVRVEGTVGRLRHDLEHYTYDDISDHLATIDRYTTLWARQAHGEGKRAGVLDGCVASSWAFIRNYVLRRGFLLGEAGLTVSTLNAYYTYAKMAKLREIARATAAPSPR